MKNVVVIDDEVEIASMIQKFLLKSDDYNVTVYNNPLTALSSIREETDIILLDIMMPQMNGLELLPKLKDKCPDAKVIMMTAYSTLDKVLESHRHGAVHYLMKPFNSLHDITKKIQEASI